MYSATVNFLLTWPVPRLARELYQHAKENAELRNHLHKLENELFWMREAEGAKEAALQAQIDIYRALNEAGATITYDDSGSWTITTGNHPISFMGVFGD